jgi:hypothetical protein
MRKGKFNSHTMDVLDILGGVMVRMFAIGPKVEGSNLAEGDGF